MAIHEEMPTNQPDHFAPILKPYAEIESDGWRGTKVIFDSHCGTHLDAPSHFVFGGASIEEIGLDRLIGSCQLVDIPFRGYDVAIDVDALPTLTESVVVIRTGWSERITSDQQGYYSHHAFLTPTAARHLVDAGVRLVGIDCPSVDLASSEAHHILLGNDVLIVENLTNLASLPALFDIIILPLPLVGGDGCPVRAVAVLEESK